MSGLNNYRHILFCYANILEEYIILLTGIIFDMEPHVDKSWLFELYKERGILAPYQNPRLQNTPIL